MTCYECRDGFECRVCAIDRLATLEGQRHRERTCYARGRADALRDAIKIMRNVKEHAMHDEKCGLGLAIDTLVNLR